ncbi:LytR/AlgR family response regulator transcription factor [uncultured Croceitalea sp.]|uniref:LytR/AlgR family response regulator transcription factor n=1 Tax=uncultured Croceitalea sp. TaxID=1798908 RepID=UPI00374FDA29
MKVVIVEDEITASNHLKYVLNNIDSTIEVVRVLDTVKSCISYFSEPVGADLVFMDIHLADGLSFELFDHVEVSLPIIFTTAYDEYALKAFSVNSIDYILKPIHQEELAKSLEKYEKLTQAPLITKMGISEMIQTFQEQKKSYKSNYLISHRDELVPVKLEDIAYFFIDTGIVKLMTVQNKTYTIDKKLEDLEQELNPEIFDRANRQYLIHRNSILKVKRYFGGKLVVQISPPAPERIVVSKAKAPLFKQWMDS